MSDLRASVVELVRERGYERRNTPFELASGEESHDYVDGKRAVADGADLRRVAEAIISEVAEPFDAAGGLTMGADSFAIAVGLTKPCHWFSVRKEPKGRGFNRWIEGRQLGSGDRVLLVDDVVTTGGSIKKAYEHVCETGAQVVAAVTMVDRGDSAQAIFRELGVPYYSLVTYRDLGIEPVGRALATPSL